MSMMRAVAPINMVPMLPPVREITALTVTRSQRCRGGQGLATIG